MSKVYWVRSGSNLTITGGTCNAHIVAELGATINVNCQTLNGESWFSGTMNLGCRLVNGNIMGGVPGAPWMAGKDIEYITGNVVKNV